MAYYLAIDAGGTKADYIIADDERILARTRSGSIKRMRVDADTAAGRLERALEQLEADSGISVRQIAATCIGTAGETVPLVSEWLKNELGKRVNGSLLIKGDVEIALEAAFPGARGMLVLAGTGSQVLGRSNTGRLYAAGGYGPVLSDQGSGHCIGVHALRAIFLAFDEERETELYGAVLEHWHLSTREELIAYANQCSATLYSGLAPVVFACAQAGDSVARAVLESEAKQLAHLVLQVMRRLRQNGNQADCLRVAMAGSILEKSALMRELLVSVLKEKDPEIEFSEVPVDSTLGALSFARASAASLANDCRISSDIN